MFKRQILLESVSALLVLLFLYTGLSKFIDFPSFIDDMNNQPFSNFWTPFLIWFIPCSEIIISALIIFERTRLYGFYAHLFLMVLFTIYTILVLAHFYDYVPCSCGGVIRRLTWTQHLFFNLFFVALSILGIILQHRKSFKSILITKNSFV